MINRLKKKYPNEVDIRCINDDGSMVAHLPYEWMRIVPKRKNTMTQEQKEAFATKMSELRQAQQLENGANSKN